MAHLPRQGMNSRKLLGIFLDDIMKSQCYLKDITITMISIYHIYIYIYIIIYQLYHIYIYISLWLLSLYINTISSTAPPFHPQKNRLEKHPKPPLKSWTSVGSKAPDFFETKVLWPPMVLNSDTWPRREGNPRKHGVSGVGFGLLSRKWKRYPKVCALSIITHRIHVWYLC